ncbi:MAG: RNA polymerase sigma-70 factor [Bacteroidota bacterium]
MSPTTNLMAKDVRKTTDLWCYNRMVYEDSEQHFELLFEKYYPQLCQLSYSKIRCEHKAKEVVSDVFIKLWQKRKKLQINGKLISYLRRAVINQTIDYLREGFRHRRFSNPLSDGIDVLEEPVLDELYAKELAVVINRVIDSLPPKGQKIFRMSRDEGMTYGQIAQALDISPRTVETHLRRSLAKIRAELSV